MAQVANAILTPEHIKVLTLLGKERGLAKRFYLTGGTALAAFFLHHRYSEDLDLFSEQEFNITPLRAFIKKIEKVLKAGTVDYHNFLGLHTFFFSLPNDEILKVDFNYYPFGRIEKGIKCYGISIDSVYDIAVNKVHTIVMKPRARDFIDIYFVIKKYGYSFDDLLKQAKIKFDWHIDAAQLGARLIQALEVKDFPRMIEKIDHTEWQNFFVQEAKKLEKEIFE